MDKTSGAAKPIPISKPIISNAEKQAVLDVLDSGILAQGPYVAALEAAFVQLVGVRHAVATSSGTSALHVALLAHGLSPGDEVITSAFTFIASVNSILYCGATPVFADVDEETFNLDPSQVEKLIGPRTRALMPVHLYGYPCDMDRFTTLARHHGLALIEDCAQAIGATYQDRPVGSFGTGAFSLYATKNVMCGEGGMITTSDDAVAAKARLLRSHGMVGRYHYDILGYNLRMTDIHAAIGVKQIDRLAEFTELRRRNSESLSGGIRSVETPRVRPSYGHVWHQYTVRIKAHRDDAVGRLNDAGIGTGIFYPEPAHFVRHVREVVGDVRLPVTERLSGEVLSLPVHPALAKDDLDRIVTAVNRL